MRFGIKTSPQDTTWSDMLAVWQAADDIELFESAWTFDHFYPIFTDDIYRPVPGGLDHHHRTGPGDPAAARRCARDRHAVPPPGGARQHGRHPRHRLGRPARARDRRRLERGGGEGLRHRPARDAHRTLRRVRRRLRGDHRAAHQRARPRSPAATCSSPTRTATRSRCSGRTRRSASAGSGERRTLRSVARFAQHWNYPGGPVEQFAAKLDVLRRHCADLGRDPTEITISTHLRAARPTSTSRRAGEALRRRRPRPRHRVPAAAAHARRAGRAHRGAHPARVLARGDGQRVQPAALRSTQVGQIG